MRKMTGQEVFCRLSWDEVSGWLWGGFSEFDDNQDDNCNYDEETDDENHNHCGVCCTPGFW